MRVIAGEFRSRRLKGLEGSEVRPTPDRLRVTLFDSIAGEVPGSIFLDAYAGTGAVGIEALSRGALRVIFIEKNRRAVTVIEENLSSLGVSGRARVIAGSVARYLAAQTADIIFLDPPYDQVREYGIALEIAGGSAARLLIAQHERRTVLAERYGALGRVREITQGDNRLTFYRPVPM